MFPQLNRNEKKPFFDLPKTKLKNISCAFCRREFIIRDFAHLRGPAIPLLLSCGHAACHQCVKIHSSDPCPLCPEQRSLTNKSDSTLLPINIYVTGLFGVIYNQPFTADEPDISFSQSLRDRTKEYSENDQCYECDAIATVRCLQCHVVYCHSCAEKIHSTLDQTEKHFRVLLTDTNKNSIFAIKTCPIHIDFLEYYCIKCDSSHCSRCMLHDHQQHTVIPQLDKNMEHMDEFQKVQDELIETLQRVRQTQKRLQKMVILPGESESSEMVETAINQHFAHLHGVLQNIERRMIDKLSKQRNYLTENVRDIQSSLKEQEDQLQSALMMAASVQEVIGKINLRDVTSELEKLADAPCHLLRDPAVNDEKIMFCPDPNIIEILENHCNLKIPKVSGYKLFRSKTLPDDYEIEPLNIQEPRKLLNESLGLNATTLVRTPSCQSVCSRRLEPQAFREGQTCLVHVCFIESPSNFYVRRWCYQDQIKKMEYQLSAYTSRYDEPSDVQINKIYAVRHETKNKWYRGRVKAINTISGVQDTYQVFDVDYGSMETQVSITRMRHIPENLSSIPQMAINCALYDIVPIDGQWRCAARKFMYEVAKPNHRGSVMMHIVNIKGNTYYVDICQEQVSVRDSLIYMGQGTFVTTQYLRRTCPQAVRKFLREDLALESFCDVVCAHVQSPDCIYVQKVGDHLQFLCSLEKDMSKHYNCMKTKSNTGMIYMPEVGLPCAVEKFEGQWCRAIVHAVPRPREIEVFLVDFGSTMLVSYEKIRKLNERFMLSPTQAIKVALTDIKPRADEWCDDAIEFTKRHLELKFVRVFAFEEKQSSYEVALYTNDEENHENFAALLAGSGLAISTGPRSSGYVNVSENQSISKNRKIKLRNSRTKANKKSKSKNVQLAQQSVTDAPRERSSCNPVNDVANDPYRLMVKIVRIISPDMIYICDISLTPSYEKMMSDMQKFYNKYKDEADCNWRIRSSCVAYSSRDRCFARGEIVGFESSDKAQVFLYDFAVTETIPIVELQSLKKKFAIAQTYVCKVKLAGILPCGGSSVWPSTSCEKLKDIVYANQNSKFYISKVVTPGDEELNVELWVEEVKIDGPLAPARIEIKSINRALVDEGLALPIKQYNEKKTTVLALELQREISFVDEASKNESAEWTENGKFKERRTNAAGKASDEIEYAESFISSASSVTSDDEDEIENATSYLDSSTSDADLPVANHTIDPLTPNNAKLDAWLPAEPIMEDHFVAVATNVDHSCCVYIYPKKNSKMVHYIEATLNATYSATETEADKFVEEWNVGDLCIAQYHANKKWYRAEVLHVMDNNMIQVKFSDYGNIEECQGSTLRKRLALTHIARQCTKCEIAGLSPDTPNGKWRIDDLDVIHHLLVDKECEITVLERKSDCLVVSIVLLSPTRFHLLPHLINELHLAARADNIDGKRTNSESERTIDNSDDVIIDGYVENVNEESIAKKNDEENFKNNDDVRGSINKHTEDGTKNVIKENGIEETTDILKTTEHPDETLTNIDNDISPSLMTNETFSVDNLCTTKTLIELYQSNDVVISGTPNFTLNVDQIESSQREAENKLENENSSDSSSIREDQIVASTPFDDSLVCHPASYKILMISKDVSPVRAEVVLVGLTNVWLHLLYNEKSESIRKVRNLYEKIMHDMQDCASQQPILKNFEKGTPCCAKYVDGMWYRCKVLKCISKPIETEQMVRVRFVDWGNEETLYCEEVRSLKDEWLEPPCMAFCCKLWGVIESPSVENDEFSKMKVRKAWKVDKKPPRPVYVKIEGRAGKFYDVRIYNDEKCTKLVYQSLLDDGLLLSENCKGD